MGQKPEEFDCEKVEEAIKPSWRRRTEKFFNNSTFNGALYIFASKSWLKRIFWGMIIVIAIGGFCAVTIKNIIRMVHDEPIVTSITLTRQRNLSFPAVTICSLSLLNTNQLKAGGPNVTKDLTILFDAVGVPTECKAIANKLARNTGLNISWGELTNIASNNFSALLKHCRYGGKSCDFGDFRPISTITGQCYTFNGPNSGPGRMAQGTGVRQGLQLRLSPDDQLFSLENDHGFRIVIHNQDELPRPESEGIAVGLNSSVYIGMRQVKSEARIQFSSSYQCRDDTSVDQDLIFPDYPNYSQSSCLYECIYKVCANRCRCIEPKLYTPRSGSQYSQFRNCTAPDLCCEIEEFFNYAETCDCRPKCITIERRLTVSSSTNSEGLVGVYVFYESLILETRETTNSYTPWSLISDIGGNTGLFLGLTLLSLVEFLMLVMGLAKDGCCYCRKHRIVRSINDVCHKKQKS